MSATIDQAAAVSVVASLKADIARLEAALGGLTIAPAKGAKAKDPNAPKREANAYIKFTVRVGELFKATVTAAKAAGDEERVKQFACPATINKQFCSFLKDQRSMVVKKDGKDVTVPDYAAWEDSEVLEAFTTWTAPTQSKMELAGKTKKAKGAASAASSDADGASSVSSTPTKERKKRGPMSEAAKATMAAKRAATLAAKAAPAPEPVAPAPAPEPVAPAPAPVAAVAPAAPKKAAGPKKYVTTYTLEQLQDFSPISIEGEDYGVNKRGDVVDDDGGFVGLYNVLSKKINRDAPKPENWDEIAQNEE
jgi:hypothetical protein